MRGNHDHAPAPIRGAHPRGADHRGRRLRLHRGHQPAGHRGPGRVGRRDRGPRHHATRNAGHEPVAITVGALRPGASQEAADALNLQISQFEAKYPWITAESEEYNWTAPTFTAAMAAGTLPDVFTIPFTDGKGLIANHQIVDIDARVRALDYADEFNPNVLVNGQDADGKIYAVPTQAYGMSLTYNRTLFTQAGLDPDQPPTTWDEVRAAAKAIADATGVAGYAEMATQNTGGWQLTTATYAQGGRMLERRR